MKVEDGVYWYRENGMLDANTYVIEDEITVVIDPGLENYLGQLLKEMRQDGIDAKDIDLIILTHLHIDHFGATAALKEASGAKVALHPLHQKYFDLAVNGVSRFFGFAGGGINVKKFDADFLLGDKLSIGNTELQMIHTPGHSPESFCFYAASRKILLSGDLVFDKSVGRTDIPGGSGEELKASINRVSTLDTELLLPGHMGIVRGRKNIQQNYEFIRQLYFDLL
jgi:glyoxylase-like metal-dependent hydrolase (beta-lactamase superfamily II)